MQSVTLYGRLLARAFITGFHNEYQLKAREKPQELHLVTGASGFSKSTRPKSELLRKWTFGDDAFFIARNKVADVIVAGSSTACIVSLHREERTVYTANLGDSGFLVIRHDEVIHRSQEQQHYFNTPFQLAVAPPPQRGQIISDSPSMAENSSFGVQEGDIILLGTDGLFDNMNEDMLLDYVSKLKDHRQDNIQKTASKIAEEAHQLAFDPDYLSPFALTAIDAGIEIRGMSFPNLLFCTKYTLCLYLPCS
eukprot:XP_014777889.1 PREDICTED: protein phosphatase PTC7 homolog [Octopus bimaculoides]